MSWRSLATPTLARALSSTLLPVFVSTLAIGQGRRSPGPKAASMLAMHRAVAKLDLGARHALVDGNRAPDLPCGVECLVKGDGRCLSIAAASIIAKVTRDRAMMAWQKYIQALDGSETLDTAPQNTGRAWSDWVRTKCTGAILRLSKSY